MLPAPDWLKTSNLCLSDSAALGTGLYLPVRLQTAPLQTAAPVMLLPYAAPLWRLSTAAAQHSRHAVLAEKCLTVAEAQWGRCLLRHGVVLCADVSVVASGLAAVSVGTGALGAGQMTQLVGRSDTEVRRRVPQRSGLLTAAAKLRQAGCLSCCLARNLLSQSDLQTSSGEPVKYTNLLSICDMT